MNDMDFSNQSYVGDFGGAVTDDYQLKMAYMMWKARQKGLITQEEFEAEDTFQLFVRKLPKTGEKTAAGDDTRSSYLLIAGQQLLMEWLDQYKFNDETLRRLKTYQVRGQQYYEDDFLEFLRNDRLRCTIRAIPDGELAFERQPIMAITAPWYQGQLLETFLLNNQNACINTATTFSHAVAAAGGRPISDMSFRRSGDIGGLAATIGAMVGGASSTSNVYAFEKYGVPLIGTMAHAWVMRWGEERAFDMWAQMQPDGMRGFLVDTFDCYHGLENAIAACQRHGVKPDFIRNDSGTLDEQAAFAFAARRILDEAGFTDCKISVTNDMNPQSIAYLISTGAPINSFGMGTWHGACVAHPTLGAVYKHAMMTMPDGTITETMKCSAERGKATFPGAQRIVRTLDANGNYAGDILVPIDMNIDDGTGHLATDLTSVRMSDEHRTVYPAGTRFIDPAIVTCIDGNIVPEQWGTVMDSAVRAKESLARLDIKHRHPTDPETYPAGVEQGLYERFIAALETNDARKGLARATPFLQPHHKGIEP